MHMHMQSGIANEYPVHVRHGRLLASISLHASVYHVYSRPIHHIKVRVNHSTSRMFQDFRHDLPGPLYHPDSSLLSSITSQPL